MDKKKKTVLFIAGGAIGLIIIVLLLRFIVNNQYRSQIPELSNTTSLSQAVREQISDALEKARRKPSADNLGMLGMVYHSSANYQQAARCYKLAIKRSRSDWTWNYYQGYLNMEMGESEAVIENFTRVIEKDPGIDLAWYYIGSEYKNLRKNELAEESFRNITSPKDEITDAGEATRQDHFPLSTYALFQLSRIYYETGRYELAEKTLDEIIETRHSFGPAYRLLGNVYSMKGDTALGEHYVVRANDLLIFSPPVDTLVDKLVLLSRSELYLLKNIDEAERSIYSEWTLRLVNHAMQYIPDNIYLISKTINICLWMGLYDQATTFIDQHISYNNENFTELNRTGMLFYMNGLYSQSIQYLTRAAELKPEDVEVQKNLAVAFRSVGDKQTCDDIMDALLENNQDNPEVQADIANTLFFILREREKAIACLTRLKQRSPSNPKVQKLSAGVAEENGNFQEAIRMYESSFKGDPQDVTTIKYLGNLLFEQKIYDKAIRHYSEALKYHPNDPYFLEKLGTLLAACPDTSLRDIEEAGEYLERAFIHISSRPNTLVSAGRSLAWVYAKLGDKQNAISTIKETINIGKLENISPTYQAELENLYKSFQALGN